MQRHGHSVADLLNELSNTYEVAERLIGYALVLDKAYADQTYQQGILMHTII